MGDRVVLVTGAKGGLGNFVTRAFLDAGTVVAGASRSISAADFAHSRFAPFPVDFADANAVKSTVEAVAGRFGRLDALVHVLGGFAGGTSVAATDDATWKQMLELNLNSAFYVLRTAIPHLRKTGAGRIVAVGSLTANEPHAGLGAYVTFKSALAVLVRTVALENKDAGLTANVVLPGTMDTPANRKAMPGADFSKWLAPQDVAKLCVLLASPQTGEINGAAIPVDGRSG